MFGLRSSLPGGAQEPRHDERIYLAIPERVSASELEILRRTPGIREVTFNSVGVVTILGTPEAVLAAANKLGWAAEEDRTVHPYPL